MKKIGLLCLALVLALGAMGGAIAYFSDTATVSSAMNTGTIDLMISQDGGSWQDNETWTVGLDFAPGDTVQKCIRFVNVGTTGGRVLKVGIANLSSNQASLADNIKLIEIYASEANETCPNGAYGNMFDAYKSATILGNGTKITLKTWSDSGICMAFWGNTTLGSTMTDYVAFGSTDVECVCLVFEFDTAAGPEYMGKTCTFDLVFQLTDDHTSITVLGSAGYA